MATSTKTARVLFYSNKRMNPLANCGFTVAQWASAMVLGLICEANPNAPTWQKHPDMWHVP